MVKSGVVSWVVVSVVLGLAVACAGCGGGGGSGTPPGGTLLTFATGSAEQVVSVPPDGCLSAPVELITETGVRLRFEAGTCLRSQEGARLTGPVLLRIDDGAEDAGWVAARIGEPVVGTARVVVGLIRDGLDPLLVPAGFDPPATVDLTAALPARFTGALGLASWFERGLDGAEEPPPPSTASSHGEPPSGIRWKPFRKVVGPRKAGGPNEDVTYAVPVSTLTGAWLADPTIPEPGYAFEGQVIHETNLGAVGTAYPRLCCITIINPDTAEIVAVGCWQPGLYLPGQARVLDFADGPDDFFVEIVEDAGQRVVRVSSAYRNRFRIRYLFCDDPDDLGARREETVDLSGGSADEADRAGPYVGRVQVLAVGCGGFPAGLQAWRSIRDAAGGWSNAALVRYRSFGGGRFGVLIDVHAWSTSVRDLIDQFPPGWVGTAGNRTVLVQIPWPKPTVISSAYNAQRLLVVDPDTLATVRTSDPLAGPPDDAVLGFHGLALAGAQAQGGPMPAPGSLTVVDVATGAVLDTVPGLPLASGLGIHPLDREVYGVTGLGMFFAFDPVAGSDAWTLSGLPAGQRFSDIAVAPDGAYAYVASLDGTVHEIDLQRRALARNWNLAAASAVGVDDAGARLAVVDDQNGGVQVLDLITNLPPLVISGPLDSFSPVFLPESDDLMVVHYANGELRVVEVPAGTTQDSPSGMGALCIASFLPGPGMSPVVITANYDDDTLAIGQVVDPALPVPLVPQPAGPKPNLVRTAGQ